MSNKPHIVFNNQRPVGSEPTSLENVAEIYMGPQLAVCTHTNPVPNSCRPNRVNHGKVTKPTIVSNSTPPGTC